MNAQVKKSRIGRKRWGPLVKFLTETMQSATSEKLRMTAALRLADVLSLREQREQLELRRELRLAEKSTGAEPETETEESPASPSTAERAARLFLESIREKVVNGGTDTNA